MPNSGIVGFLMVSSLLLQCYIHKIQYIIRIGFLHDVVRNYIIIIYGGTILRFRISF